MEPIYMTMGIHTEGGVPKTPSTRYHTNRNDAERQYCLYRAAAATSVYEVDTAVLMTIDGFVLESKTYTHELEPAPEPEPDPEPETNDGTESESESELNEEPEEDPSE